MRARGLVEIGVRSIAVVLLGALASTLLAPVPVVSAQAASPLVIHEIFYNPNGQDEGHEFIELHNSSLTTLELSGVALVSGVSWVAPAGSTLGAGGYFVIARDADRFLAEFGVAPDDTFQGKLSNGGEKLTLADANGLVDIVEYSDTLPWPTAPDGDGASLQLLDVAADNNQPAAWGQGNPTPGAASAQGQAPPPIPSPGRGVYEADVVVSLQSVPGAAVFYTLDGGRPTSSSTRYTAPFTVSAGDAGVTTLRAIAIGPDLTDSAEAVHSYVIAPSFPFGDGNWSQAAMVSLNLDNSTYPTGLRQRASIDFFEPGSTGFGVTAGINTFGSISQSFEKESFRMFFDSEWGPSSLNYDLFADFDQGTFDPTDSFDKLELRGMSLDGYPWRNGSPLSGDGVDHYISDRWWKDTVLDLGTLTAHGRYAHLFVNGEYEGVYQVRERLDEQFFASYLGGDASDYEATKWDGNLNSGTVVTPPPHDLWDAASQATAWSQVRDLIDPAALVHTEILRSIANRSEEEYRLIGSPDPAHPSGAILRFTDIDFFFGVGGQPWAPHSPSENGTLSWLWKWRSDPDFSAAVRAATFSAFCNNGALTTQAGVQRLDYWADQIRTYMPGEQARWDPNRFEASIAQARSQLLGENNAIGLDGIAQIWEQDGLFDGCAAGARPELLGPPNSVLVAGTDVALPLTIVDPDNDPISVSVLSGLPAGLSIGDDGIIRGQTDATSGDYQVTLILSDDQGNSSKWVHELTVIDPGVSPSPRTPLVLNEYNAVDSDAGTWAGNDPAFGADPDNGGDWIEFLVSRGDVDLRGWGIELWDSDRGSGRLEHSTTYVLADHPIWDRPPRGSIITLREAGTQDLSFSPEAGDWNIHLSTTGGLVSGPPGFDSTRRDQIVMVFDGSGNLAGPILGESQQWAAAGGANVTAESVMTLCVDPSQGFDELADYSVEREQSSFGQPNQCDGQTQEVGRWNRADVNCDDQIDVTDVLVTLEYGVGSRTATSTCPLANPATQILADAGDVNCDGRVNIADALFTAQYAAGSRTATTICPLADPATQIHLG